MHYNCILAEIFLSIKPGVRDEKTVHGAGRTGKMKKERCTVKTMMVRLARARRFFLFHGPR
jgi:hypothetical protein